MLSQNQLTDFKTNICDENKIISSILVADFAKYFIEPILDVGSSSGDILLSAFPNKNVIHLDRDVIDRPAVAPASHTFVQGDFFGHQGEVGTLFLGHVLQYIDDDLTKLIDTVINLAPQFIVTVTNKNDDLLGKIISVLDDKDVRHNAEQDISYFSDGFILEKETPFTATMRTDSIDSLVKYLSGVILDANKPEVKEEVKNVLDANLTTSTMTINETIRVFKRN